MRYCFWPKQTEELERALKLRVEAVNHSWMQRHAAALAQTVGRPHDARFGIVFVRGAGARLWDVDGHEFFDLTCGFSAANFGHGFASILQIANSSLQQIGHLTSDAHPAKIELAEQLVSICGFALAGRELQSQRSTGEASRSTPMGKVIFNATGARAIETAWKAAVAFRPGKLLVLSPGFHGKSIATSQISATTSIEPSLAIDQFELEPVERYPYCARCPKNLVYPSCSVACGERLFQKLEQQAADYSALLVEPALGARGYVFPPDEFFLRLRAITQNNGVLMIADEIQTGLGRCGAWLLSHRQAWQPDLVVLGKSLGGGVTPISAVVGRAEVLDAIPCGAESETFAATPLACAVALQVIAELRMGPWMARGEVIGEQLRQWFDQHPKRTAWGINKVEGIGCVCALELESKAAAAELASTLFRAGVLVHLTGPEQTRIVLLPPLTISDDELSRVFFH